MASRRIQILGDLIKSQFPVTEPEVLSEADSLFNEAIEGNNRTALIQERAYLKWQSRYGNPVSEEETQEIWFEAEREIDKELFGSES